MGTASGWASRVCMLHPLHHYRDFLAAKATLISDFIQSEFLPAQRMVCLTATMSTGSRITRRNTRGALIGETLSIFNWRQVQAGSVTRR